jgi:mRNA interferase MazF
MITSASNRNWPGDVAIVDHVSSGLPVPSVVRVAKIATVETAQLSRRGQLDPATLTKVMHEFQTILKRT